MLFNQVADALIFALAQSPHILTKEAFQKMANGFYRDFGCSKPLPNILLFDRYRTLVREKKLTPDARIERLFRKRDVRSDSGVAVISILTKPYPCPGACIYCPNVADLPKSYIPGEPAVQRAQMNHFDAFAQVVNRLYSLYITGHEVQKCDVRIIGGSWSFYERAYQEQFILDMYDAHTLFADILADIEQIPLAPEQDFFALPPIDTYTEKRSKNLQEAKQRNEGAFCRVIGVAVETRPDNIDPQEIVQMRKYGVTRVEIGYQTTIEEIHHLNKRGHGNKESIAATELLKDAGIKVVAHMMPNLFGATPQTDLSSFADVFENPAYRPDELKIYPLVVTANTFIEKYFHEGKFTPYNNETLIELLAHMYALVPEWNRLNRLYRDIPASEIIAGCKIANLRQKVEQRMKELALAPHDISAREVRAKNVDPQEAILDITSYEASGGTEYFLQYVLPDRTLLSLLRLRIPATNTPIAPFFPELQGTAIIREVHSFGSHLGVGAAGQQGQHLGFGKKLIAQAEEIVRNAHPDFTKMAVISGVWVRKYYEKLGYELKWEYMVKDL